MTARRSARDSLPIVRLLVDGQKEAAGHCLDLLQDLFPGRLYIELQRHGLSTEQAIEPDLLELADATGLPLVVHTRSSSADTVGLLRDEGPGAVRGVFHCFTETVDVAGVGW